MDRVVCGPYLACGYPAISSLPRLLSPLAAVWSFREQPPGIRELWSLPLQPQLLQSSAIPSSWPVSTYFHYLANWYQAGVLSREPQYSVALIPAALVTGLALGMPSKERFLILIPFYCLMIIFKKFYFFKMHLSMRVSLRKQFSLEAPGAVAWIQAECRVALFLECLNTPAGKDYGVARQQDRGRRTAPAEFA